MLALLAGGSGCSDLECTTSSPGGGDCEPMDICRLAENDIGVINADVVSIDSPQYLCFPLGGQGTQKVPTTSVTLANVRVVQGTGPSTPELLFLGFIDSSGNSEGGPLKDSTGAFRNLYLFVLSDEGQTPMYANSCGGQFWRTTAPDGGAMLASEHYGGLEPALTEQQFLDQVSTSWGTTDCP